MPRSTGSFGLLALALVCLPGLACKTLSEVSVGYADAISTSELPGEGPWTAVEVGFPALTALDPLASPSLSRYAVTPADVDVVRATRVELDGPTGECGLPFTRIELRLRAAELGATTLATAARTGDCLIWTLTPDLDLAPWFRQPSVTLDALVDGAPLDAALPLSLRVAFLVDLHDKRID